MEDRFCVKQTQLTCGQPVWVLPGSLCQAAFYIRLQHWLKDAGAVRQTIWSYHGRSCGPMDRASDYESGDCRFESCQDQTFLLRCLQLCLVATFGLKDFDADQSFLKIQLYHGLQEWQCSEYQTNLLCCTQSLDILVFVFFSIQINIH